MDNIKILHNFKNIILDIILATLFFCYIFMFNIYGPIDSSILVSIIMILFVSFSKKFRQLCITNIKKLNLKKFLIVSAIIVAWSIFVILINKTNDVSFLKNLAKLAITIITGYLLYSLTYFCNRSSKIINYIILAFLAQTIFQWICFVAPDLSKLFDFFRGEEALAIATKKYSGYRGLALSRNPFFTLSISYGVASIIYASKYNTLFKDRKVLKILFFIVLISGNIFAGRIGFIALLFIPFIIKYHKPKWHKPNKKTVITSIAIILGIVGTIIAVSPTPQAQKLYKYAFEATNNLFSGKGIKTDSTNGLIRMLDRSFTPKTILIGDGKYKDGNNYYMKTDVGYYRKIYYGGLTLLILMIIWHLTLAGKNAKRKEYILITIFLLIMEIKGVAIGQTPMVYAILTLFVFRMDDYYTKLHHNKKASILLPTLNTNSDYLKSSINSILKQTHTNFELLIIVDGGHDDDIIKKLFDDNRIIIIKHSKTQGIAKSLNDAIKQSTGDYLVRMDADDVSRLNRIEEQIIYMEEHPNITVAGTFYKKFGAKNHTAFESFTKPSDIRARTLFIDSIAHPTVIMRAKTIKENNYYYDKAYERAEDYELWDRIMNGGNQISIMKFCGLYYRTHSGQVSVAKRHEQLAQAKRIHLRSLKALNLKQSDSEYLFELAGQNKLTNKKALKDFVKRTLSNNKKYKIYNQHALRKTLYAAYSLTCYKNRIFIMPNIYFMLFCLNKLFFRLSFSPIFEKQKEV